MSIQNDRARSAAREVGLPETRAPGRLEIPLGDAAQQTPGVAERGVRVAGRRALNYARLPVGWVRPIPRAAVPRMWGSPAAQAVTPDVLGFAQACGMAMDEDVLGTLVNMRFAASAPQPPGTKRLVWTIPDGNSVQVDAPAGFLANWYNSWYNSWCKSHWTGLKVRGLAQKSTSSPPNRTEQYRSGGCGKHFLSKAPSPSWGRELLKGRASRWPELRAAACHGAFPATSGSPSRRRPRCRAAWGGPPFRRGRCSSG